MKFPGAARTQLLHPKTEQLRSATTVVGALGPAGHNSLRIPEFRAHVLEQNDR
mgnify:CR=1 FL=1